MLKRIVITPSDSFTDAQYSLVANYGADNILESYELSGTSIDVIKITNDTPHLRTRIFALLKSELEKLKEEYFVIDIYGESMIKKTYACSKLAMIDKIHEAIMTNAQETPAVSSSTCILV